MKLFKRENYLKKIRGFYYEYEADYRQGEIAG